MVAAAAPSPGFPGPETALGLIDRLDLDSYRYLHSTRADFLRRLGRAEEAEAAYVRALELTTGDAERRFLERRARECSAMDGEHVVAERE